LSRGKSGEDLLHRLAEAVQARLSSDPGLALYLLGIRHESPRKDTRRPGTATCRDQRADMLSHV
jgi:hypothetical protein